MKQDLDNSRYEINRNELAELQDKMQKEFNLQSEYQKTNRDDFENEMNVKIQQMASELNDAKVIAYNTEKDNNDLRIQISKNATVIHDLKNQVKQLTQDKATIEEDLQNTKRDSSQVSEETTDDPEINEKYTALEQQYIESRTTCATLQLERDSLQFQFRGAEEELQMKERKIMELQKKINQMSYQFIASMESTSN